METKKYWDSSCLSAGERCALKRCAGDMTGSMQAWRAFYHAIGYCTLTTEKERIYFAVLCMECLWKEEELLKAQEQGTIQPFEQILYNIYMDKNTTESRRRKLTDFLDIPWREDGFLLGKLCSWARFIKAQVPGIIPDFQKLAKDLKNWNDPKKSVQKNWVQTICLGNKKEETEETKNAD